MGRILEQTTLTNVARGLAPQLFARELAKVLENIADTRTPAQAKRQIVLMITFKPGLDRREIEVSVDADSKVAKSSGVKGLMFAALGDGGLTATNSDPEQLTLADELARAQERKEASNG